MFQKFRKSLVGFAAVLVLLPSLLLTAQEGRPVKQPVPDDIESVWFVFDAEGIAVDAKPLVAAVKEGFEGSFLLESVKVGAKKTTYTITISKGSTPLPPLPPIPPVPPVPPTPMPPLPDGEGFRVLMVWEDEDRGRIPMAQLYAMMGKDVTSYLNANCAKDKKGKADWMLVDDDLDPNDFPPRWQKPYKDAVEYFRKDNKPSIVVSNTNGKHQPPGELTKVPATEVDIMQLLKKYGDN